MRLREGRGIQQTADRRAKAFEGFTGFGENLGAAVSMIIDEEQSISSTYDYKRTDDNLYDSMVNYLGNIGNNFYARRNKQIKALVEGGVIDQGIMDAFSTKRPGHGYEIDYNGIANYVNENLDIGTELATDESYEDPRNEEFQSKKLLREDIQARQTGTGTIGEYAGYALGGVTDPLVAISMPFSAPLVGITSVSRTAYTLSTAGRVALFEMGVQSAIEPFVHNWKEEIGMDYTWRDSLFNVVGAGLLSGPIAGVAANIGHRFAGPNVSNWLRVTDYDGLVARNKKIGMNDEEATTLAGLEYEANLAPDPKKDAATVIEEIEVKQEKMVQQGAETGDVVPVLDATEGASAARVSKETDKPGKKAKKTKKPRAKKKAKKKAAAARAAEAGDETEEGGFVSEYADREGGILARGESFEDRKAEILARRATRLEEEGGEPQTLVDEMFEGLPDDEFMTISGQNVPIKHIADEMDADTVEIDAIVECLING